MEELFIFRIAILQEYLLLLEGQSAVLSDFEDMERIRRHGSEVNDFIAAHAVKGNLPESPLAYAKPRINRLAEFFRAADAACRDILAWKNKCLIEIASMRGSSLVQVRGRNDRRKASLHGTAASTASMLNHLDWTVNGDRMDVHPYILDYANFIALDGFPGDSKQRGELKEFCEGSGPLWTIAISHLDEVSSSLDRRIKFVQREAAEAEAAEAKLYLRHKQDIDAALEHLKKENFLSAKELWNKLGEKKFLDLPYADVLREIESQRVLVEKFREVDNHLNKAYLADEIATADLMRTVGELRNINEAASLRNPGSELSREIFSLLKSIGRKLDGLVLQAAKKKLRKRTYIIFGVTFGACSLLLLLVIIWVARENAAAREEKAAEEKVAEEKAAEEKAAAREEKAAEEKVAEEKAAEEKAAEEKAAKEKAAAFDLRRATNAAPYINTLRMEFVPVKTTPGVLWSRWETRVRDYAAFCLETNRAHEKPDFEQGDDHPVVEVSFKDAQAFCVWLSKKEGRTYRLPTDHEWSCAVGIGAREDAAASPKAKDMGIKGVYPWGTAWPPPKGSGNFNSYLKVDSYDNTSPVGSFSPTADGLYDLSGNVLEWCDSQYNPNATDRVLRGGSWVYNSPAFLLSSFRSVFHPSYPRDIRGFRVVLGVGGGG